MLRERENILFLSDTFQLLNLQIQFPEAMY